MAQHDTSSESLEQEVERWLSEQGYPLEMEVARSFMKAGFHVGQSRYYTDPDEGKPREIDILATTGDVVGECSVYLTFTIECKLCRRAPWVMFASDAQGLAARFGMVTRPSSKFGRGLMARLSRREELRKEPFFESKTAFGITEALRREDKAFAAVNSAAKAAHAEVASFEATDTGDASLLVTFPVVVIDGRLFEYRLRSGGGTALQEISRGSLLWQYPGQGTTASLVSIVTLADLESFVEDAASMTRAIIDCKDDISAVEDAWRAEERKRQSKGLRTVISRGVER